MTDADLTRVRTFIALFKWKFASTMAHIPHWYVVRGDLRKMLLSNTPSLNPVWGDKEPNVWLQDEFVWFVELIRSVGYQQRWGKYNHHYLDVDGFKYWTMGDTIPNTIILNRAEL